jgi:hypothetical protein
MSTQMRTMTLVPHEPIYWYPKLQYMSLVGSLRGVQAIPEPCNSNSNSKVTRCSYES